MVSRLNLDLGTTTGYCLLSGDKDAGLACVSGVQSFKNDRYSGGGMRFLRFRRWLDETYAAMPFASVHFEEVRRHMGTDAAHVYGGLLGILTAWCEEKEIPYEGVPVGTIKKFAAGHGGAPKAAMIAAAQKWGFQPVDDNEADAICLAFYVAENFC